MTEEEEPGVHLPLTPEFRQQTHFLRDVIFHGKFRALTAEENTSCQHGLFFQDGQRHVDYILTYPVREPDGGRSNLQPEHRPNENDVTHSHGSQTQGGDHQLLQTHPSSFQSSPAADVEKGRPEETFSSPDDLKAARREEFEAKLRTMGLELERDEETTIPGVGFVKIHAPWNVLCREAELMKLKMPTKKVYEVQPSSSVLKKISSFVNKVLEPLHPHVEEHQQTNIKQLSHTFSREKQHLIFLACLKGQPRDITELPSV